MKRLTRYIYGVLGIVCTVVWIITTALQVIHPHPYRGLIGNIAITIGVVLLFIRAKLNHKKSFLYDPDKKKHFRNWVVYILILAITVIVVVFFYYKVFNFQ